MHTFAFIASLIIGVEAAQQPTVVIVVGAPGAPEYGVKFNEWADRWGRAARQAGARCVRIGSDASPDRPDRERLEALLAGEVKELGGPLWLILIGHGTFDQTTAKFNMRGPDVAAVEAAAWLKPYARPIVVVNCTSSSAPFINRLSGPDRVIVTATKSGYEQNYARFGEYLSAAIGDRAADLDKDEQVSLLEAFLFATSRVAEYYEQHARLSTETALLDDNGDGLGTPGAWFHGIHATRTARDGASLDGSRAHQLHLIKSRREQTMPPEVRARRDDLERAVAALREAKGKGMDEEAYYAQLEPLMIELARLYAALEKEKAGAAQKHGD